MAADDRSRLNLYQKLESILGTEEADTLMAHLPPLTWNQIATKSDLDHLHNRLTTELRAEMNVGFAALRAEMVEGVNRQIKWLVTFAAAWTSLLLAVVRLGL
jgi:hypothetical protein